MAIALRLPVLALFVRALRMEARAAPTYLVRAIAIAFLLFGLLIAAKTARFTGAPGIMFFGQFIAFNLIGISLLGCSSFATVITEERSERTLGLLRMTSLNSAAILCGKTGGRLASAMLLVVVQLPLVFLSLALGGVSPEQVLAAGVVLAAWLLFCAGLGLFASVVFLRSFAASAFSFVVLFAIAAGPDLYEELVRDIYGRKVAAGPWAIRALQDAFEALRVVSPIERIGKVLSGGRSVAIFTWQSGLVAGIACVLGVAGWAIFHAGRRDEIVAGGAHRWGLWRRRRRRRLGARRDPIAWKEFHVASGGRSLFLLRAVVLLLAAGVALWLEVEYRKRRDFMEFIERLLASYGEALLGIGLVAYWLETSILGARIFRVEVRGQTWPALMTLPFGLGRIVYSKLKGCLPCLLPSVVVVAAGAVCVVAYERRFFERNFRSTEDVLWLTLTCGYFLVHPVLVAYCSLLVRRGAIVVSVAAEVLLLLAILIVCEFLIPGYGGDDDQLPVLHVAMAGAALALPFAIRQRLLALAGA